MTHQTHVLASLCSAFYRTSDRRPSLSINKSSLMSNVFWIQCAFYYRCASCPMRNLRWPIEDITIYIFLKLRFFLSFLAIKFTLSETARARDKVFFD